MSVIGLIINSNVKEYLRKPFLRETHIYAMHLLSRLACEKPGELRDRDMCLIAEDCFSAQAQPTGVCGFGQLSNM